MILTCTRGQCCGRGEEGVKFFSQRVFFLHPLKCCIGMFALCDIAIDCIVCMFVYICVTMVDAHKGPLMELNPILFYSILSNHHQ